MSKIRYDSQKLLAKWVASNSDEILQIFWDIEHQGEDANYFAMRESLKLEYDILKQHESLRKSFCKNKQYLI
jgi:hypothetical protein